MKLKFVLIQLLLATIFITGCSLNDQKEDLIDSDLANSDGSYIEEDVSNSDYNTDALEDYALQLISFFDELKASDDIYEIVKNYDDLTGIYIYILSKDGDILYHPDESLIGKNIANELPLGKDIIIDAKADQFETIKYVYNQVNRKVLFTIINEEIVVASYEDK